MTERDRRSETGIRDFNGHYQFLNNDHPAWTCLDGILFPSASIAYQAARTPSIALRKKFAEVKLYQEYRELAMSFEDPKDWEIRRYRVMEKIVRDKFRRSRDLSSRLAATVPQMLFNSFEEGGQVENYWGVVQGKGHNSLGKILMSVREDIVKGQDTEKWVEDQGVEGDHRKRREVALHVTKEKKPVEKLFLEKKGKFMLGKDPSNDFCLEHPSISKIHACIYFSSDGRLMLVDLGSSNSTFVVRGGQEKAVRLHGFELREVNSGDILIFGKSSRQYTVQIK